VTPSFSDSDGAELPDHSTSRPAVESQVPQFPRRQHDAHPRARGAPVPTPEGWRDVVAPSLAARHVRAVVRTVFRHTGVFPDLSAKRRFSTASRPGPAARTFLARIKSVPRGVLGVQTVFRDVHSCSIPPGQI